MQLCIIVCNNKSACEKFIITSRIMIKVNKNLLCNNSLIIQSYLNDSIECKRSNVCFFKFQKSKYIRTNYSIQEKSWSVICDHSNLTSENVLENECPIDGQEDLRNILFLEILDTDEKINKSQVAVRKIKQFATSIFKR